MPDSEKPNWQLEIRGEAAPIWNKECLIECARSRIKERFSRMRESGRERKTKKFNRRILVKSIPS